jgi:hypothetical protein
MANSNNFLVTVADAVLRDPNTGYALAYGKANIDSALTITTAETVVTGGKNNPVLYVYKHDRKVEVKITQAIFTETLLALNAGTNALNGAVTALATDCVVLSASGSATLTQTPTGGVVTVFYPNGTTANVTPVGTAISGLTASQKVDAVYPYTVTADRITVETINPPSVVDLWLLAEVRDNTGVILYNLQVNIPRYQVSGNYTMSLTANGVSNQALDGTALAVASTDCSTGELYATVTWVPTSSTTIAVSDVVATPTSMAFSAALKPYSKQASLWGLRGGIYSNINLTTSASWTVSSGCALGGLYTVGAHTGLITGGSNIAAGYTAVISACYTDATNGLLSDTISITTTA